MNDFPQQVEPIGEETKRSALLLKGLLLLALFLVLSMAWRWTPINEFVNLQTILQWQASMRNHPAAFPFVIGAYVVGGMVLFPVTLLNVATILTFGVIRGNIYALAGWLFSAALGYGMGRVLGHDLLRHLGPRLDRLIDQATGHGFLSVLTMRVLPVAPFTVVNFFVGACGIRFRDFMLASLIGRIPGIILLTFAGLQLELTLRDPSIGSIAFLGLIVLLTPVAAWWFTRQFRSGRWHPRKAPESKGSRRTVP